MHTRRIVGGSTDQSVVIRIVDSTDGTPETGVVYNTSGIDLEYRREGAASVDITEATLAALTTAHADGGFLHIGNGYYRLDLPDAAVAAGVAGVLVHGTVTGMIVMGCYIEIITSTVDANIVQISGDSGAADALEIAYDGTAGPVPEHGISDQGTAQSATATTVVLRAAAAFADDTLIGCVIGVLGSTQGYWQFRSITDNVLSTDTVTVDTWTVTPSGTITYKIWGSPPASTSAPVPANIVQIGGDAVTADAADNFNTFFDNASTVSAVVIDDVPDTGGGLDAAATRAALGMSSANLDTQLGGLQSDTNDIQTRLPAALTGGRIDASVGAMAAGVVTAAAIATNAIDADAIASDAVTEIQSGLATAAALTTVDDLLDTEMPALTAAVAALQADVTDLDTRIPAALVGGRIDSEVGSINGTAVNGNGSGGTPWGP